MKWEEGKISLKESTIREEKTQNSRTERLLQTVGAAEVKDGQSLVLRMSAVITSII